MSSSLVTWSRSTAESPTSGSSGSSSSNSSDSGFSLMRDTVSGKDGAKVNQIGRRPQRSSSLDQVVHLEDRQQHREYNGHHEAAHAHNQHWAEQSHHTRQKAVQLAFLRDRGTFEHTFQLAAGFSARDQVDGHRREQL